MIVPAQVSPNPVQEDSAHCGALPPSGQLRVAPADPAKRYLRCGTLGGEVRWRVALSPDHSRFAARTNVGTVRLVSTQPWRELTELAAPLGRVDAVAFAPDGDTLATFSIESGQVALWNTDNGVLERAYAVRNVSRAPSPRAASMAFSRDGQRIAVSAHRVLDLTTGETRVIDYAPDAPEPDFRALTFLADDHTLLADGLYRQGKEEISETLMLIVPERSEHRVLFDGFSSFLHGVATSPDLTRIALASGDPRRPGLFVHHLDEAAPIAHDPAFEGQVLAFSADGARLFVAKDDSVIVRDAQTLAEIRRFAWSPDSRFLGRSPAGDVVAASAYETVWWDPTTGLARRRVSEALTEVTFSQDGVLGAASTGSTLVRLWSEKDGAERCHLPRRDAAVPVLDAPPPQPTAGYVPSASNRVSLVGRSQDGSVLATRTAGNDGTSWVSLIDATSNRTLRAFAINPSTVYVDRGPGVALSEDGYKAYTLEAEGVLGHDPYVAAWCRDGHDRPPPSK
ncbi:MAG: WD40 repeat domain-containing protein [Polyangiales bacterium]